MSALKRSRGAIDTVREYVLSTAISVQEQIDVTHDMSLRMDSGSKAVSAITNSIGEISFSIQKIMAAVSKTKSAAQVLGR
ncbi:hypothetical protein [Azospirillum doebereinerae]